MGANVFMITAKGHSARGAFHSARRDAFFCNWPDGAGTIAEKDSFNVIALKEGLEPRDYANKLIDDHDPRVGGKCGPAGCFDLGGGRYFFFGWASS